MRLNGCSQFRASNERIRAWSELDNTPRISGRSGEVRLLQEARTASAFARKGQE
jgi:hypothetical protein